MSIYGLLKYNLHSRAKNKLIFLSSLYMYIISKLILKCFNFFCQILNKFISFEFKMQIIIIFFVIHFYDCAIKNLKMKIEISCYGNKIRNK